MTSRLAVAVLLISLVPACKSLKELIGGQAPDASPAAPVVVADTKITEVTFVRKVPKVGTKVEMATKTAFKFTFEGKIFRESSEDAALFTVQGADEFRVTKAAIEVKQLYTTKQEGTGDEKKSVNPLAGSRFVVSRNDDGKLTALDSGGAKVIPLQLAQIQEHFANVFDAEKTQEFLPKRPVKIGEKLIPSSDAVIKLLGQKDDGNTTIDGVEFILQSATPELATFAVSMTFTQKLNPKIRLRAKLEGTLDVRPKDSAITAIDVKGPLNLLGPSGNDKGTGDLTFKGTETFL
jgi:hypothetical protein